MNIIDQKNFYIVGIKGVAMTNLAIILKKMGKSVRGSDSDDEFITDESLRKNNIPFDIGFNPSAIPHDTQVVIYSAAHKGEENEQVQYAKSKGIATFHQISLLSNIMDQCHTKIAVCGCHGKTTTSSLLSYALLKLRQNPNYLVGAPSFTEFDGANYHNDRSFFVVEADEYGLNPPKNVTPKFYYLNPDLILCTNIDYDHPDVYKDIEHVKQAYIHFFNKKELFLCIDDENTKSILPTLSQKIHTFGFSNQAETQIFPLGQDETYSKFEILYKKQRLGIFQSKLFGNKNLSNIAGAISVLLALGFQSEEIKSAIQDFAGAKRRFEFIYEKNKTYLFDDYAHHPQEIEATLTAASQRFPERRIIVLFQPHTYSRTIALKNEFIQALGKANLSILLPIFASARETQTKVTFSSKDLSGPNIVPVDSKESAIEHMRSYLKPGDVILTLGAGDIYKLKNDIIRAIDAL